MLGIAKIHCGTARFFFLTGALTLLHTAPLRVNHLKSEMG